MEVDIAKQLDPKNSLTSSFLTRKKAPLDLIIISSIIIIVYFLMKFFDVTYYLSDHIIGLHGNYGYSYILKLLILFFLTTIGFIIFTFRRFKEYKKDLDEWMEVDYKLHQYEKKFELITYNVPGIAIYGVSRDHIITSWNHACEKIYGFNDKEAMGKKVEDLIVPSSSHEIFYNNIDKYYDDEIEVHQGEIQYLHKDRSIITVLTNFHKHETAFGEQELFNLSVDMTELKKIRIDLKESNTRLHALARTDALTQLPNRRAILEKIEYEKLKFERSKEVFTIAIVDLDNFKNINDKYGHECGDFVLKQISNLMVDLVRKQDIVGRYGGDEFILLLPQTDTNGALHVIHLFLKQIAKFPITFKDKEISLTVTIGINDYNNIETTVSDLIRKADKSMYKGKSQGKNKVVVA